MPELPEVQTVVSTLQPLLTGRKFCEVALLRADILSPRGLDLEKRLKNQQVLAISRRGKKILIHLAGGPALCIHLGMTGRLTVQPASSAMLKHTHFTATIAAPAGQEPQQLRFRDPRRFGGLFWFDRPEDAEVNLGPEPLKLRTPHLARLLARTRRPIKSALLDQTLIAGLGNIYADEALFLARIHPLAVASELAPKDISGLNRSIKQVLRRAILHRGSTLRDYVDASGQPGNFRRLHQVYAREGQPCNRCQTPLKRIVLSGRSTHFCPKCQKPYTR